MSYIPTIGADGVIVSAVVDRCLKTDSFCSTTVARAGNSDALHFQHSVFATCKRIEAGDMQFRKRIGHADTDIAVMLYAQSFHFSSAAPCGKQDRACISCACDLAAYLCICLRAACVIK